MRRKFRLIQMDISKMARLFDLNGTSLLTLSPPSFEHLLKKQLFKFNTMAYTNPLCCWLFDF